MADANGVEAKDPEINKEEVEMKDTEESIETKKDDKNTTNQDDKDVNEETQTQEEKDTSPPTSLEKKIIRQIEYYFGDINLSRDKFLQEEVKKDDGWVALETMIKFNRLKALSTEFTVICTALKKSDADLMEVSEDKSHIRRNPHKPLPEDNEEHRTEMNKRTVYAKGFPLDTELDSILEFFQEMGNTENVMMRRDNRRKFKGSVFVIFATEELAKEFMAKEGLKFGENDLIKYLKEDYYKMKKEEHKKGKEENQKKKKEDKQKKEKEREEELLQKITKGAILKVTGLPKNLDREELKEFFGKFGSVAWADYSKGDPEAQLRFSGEGEAKKAWDKATTEAADSKVMLKDKELSATVLEGDDELQYWKDMFQSQSDKKKRGGRGAGRGGRGGGRGGRGGFNRNRRPEGKRKTFDDDGNEQPPPKQIKTGGD